MITPGNSKLGAGRRLWSFGLPSAATCPGRSPACEAACYSRSLERLRPSVRLRYARNLALSRRPDFAGRMLAALADRRVAVLRVHVGGDFYSARYARKWLAVMRRAPGVTFYFYTRSWRVPAIRPHLAAMSRLPNVRAWFSCDRDTGAPRRVPRRARLAWLMTGPDDLPLRADLVFRVRALRRAVRKRVPCGGEGKPLALVCPVENGATGHRTDCGRCGICWRPPGDGPSPAPRTAAGPPTPSPTAPSGPEAGRQQP